MSEVEEATSEFLRRADEVFEEYDRGAVSAEVALDVLSGHVGSLRDALHQR